MRYVAAIISSIIIFVAVWFLFGLFFIVVLPENWCQFEITIGAITATIPSLIGLFIGIIAAKYTFTASLHAKTGQLYRKKKSHKDEQPSDKKKELAK
jgi:uncharacterized membrane protein